MQQLIDSQKRPGLLVSVRDAAEALAALDGGAHVIDIKDPARGSLGAADTASIVHVLKTVHNRAPVTAAAGELRELQDTSLPTLPRGLSLFKIGLAGCRSLPDWKSKWLRSIEAFWPDDEAAAHAVAVAYADWRSIDAPPPEDVFQFAAQTGCPALLLDTFDKTAGDLFNHCLEAELTRLTETVQNQGMLIVLAGSLAGDSFTRAANLYPDLLAVRTAACSAGRNGTVSQRKVAALRTIIDGLKPAPMHATREV